MIYFDGKSTIIILNIICNIISLLGFSLIICQSNRPHPDSKASLIDIPRGRWTFLFSDSETK